MFWTRLASQNSNVNPLWGAKYIWVGMLCILQPKSPIISEMLRDGTCLLGITNRKSSGTGSISVSFDDLEWPSKAGCKGNSFSDRSPYACSYSLTYNDQIQGSNTHRGGSVARGSATPPSQGQSPKAPKFVWNLPLLVTTPSNHSNQILHFNTYGEGRVVEVSHAPIPRDPSAANIFGTPLLISTPSEL